MSAPSSFVHAFVPASQDGLPTILALHGTGGDERDLLPLVAPWLPGAAILAPRGKVLESGMPRYFRRLAVGVLDAEDMQRRAIELADFVGEAAAHYGFDGARIVAVGYSNGANIASAMMMLRPSALAGALLIRPMMLPFVPDPLPALSGVRVHLLSGTRDEFSPRAETLRLLDLYEKCSADASISWTNAGHGLVAQDLEIAADWMRTWESRDPAQS